MMNAVWSRNAVLYEMNLRQATPEGTLAAAAERLGFLRDLGIDAVWLMPHYPIGEVGRKGSLGSYYSIRDYRAVDPELGTLADFDAFVRRAHALGMKVLIDWVANHTSRDARWLAECPSDWYERDASGRPVVPNGWDDTAKLPEVEIKKPASILARETISSMQAGIVYGCIGQTEYIINQIIKETGYTDVVTVATGGLGKIIFDETDTIQIYDPDLTLHGLRLIYNKNR